MDGWLWAVLALMWVVGATVVALAVGWDDRLADRRERRADRRARHL
jgi:hypothetical protein